MPCDKHSSTMDLRQICGSMAAHWSLAAAPLRSQQLEQPRPARAPTDSKVFCVPAASQGTACTHTVLCIVASSAGCPAERYFTARCKARQSPALVYLHTPN